jgi:hypothetical protein
MWGFFTRVTKGTRESRYRHCSNLPSFRDIFKISLFAKLQAYKQGWLMQNCFSRCFRYPCPQHNQSSLQFRISRTPLWLLMLICATKMLVIITNFIKKSFTEILKYTNFAKLRTEILKYTNFCKTKEERYLNIPIFAKLKKRLSLRTIHTKILKYTNFA